MTVSDPTTQPITLDWDITRIILTFSEYDPMPRGRYVPGNSRSRGSQIAMSTSSESPRRRSVAIQDLLNPAGGDDENVIRRISQQNDQYVRDDRERSWSRHSSPDLSIHPSPRPRSSGGRPSPRMGRERREFRPTYSEEEVNFIWYHREDLGWEWKDVRIAFNRQFPGREIGGIQCKYYRHLENNGVPQVRRRDRTTSAAERYSMRANTGLWYPWMR